MAFLGRSIRYAAAISLPLIFVAKTAGADLAIPLVRYSEARNVISVANIGSGSTEAKMDLPALARALRNPAILREESPGVWRLGANLTIDPGVRFNLTDATVAWLKLESGRGGYVGIVNYAGTLLIRNTKITSWDSAGGTFDTFIDDGRAYLVTYGPGRMDIAGSALMFLGSPPREGTKDSQGVHWNNVSGLGVSGEVTDSTFAYNFIGVFTSGAGGMRFLRNSFHNNMLYGLDPHDDSRDFLVEENKFFDNGANGLIFAEGGTGNIIRKNEFSGNKENGLALYNEVNGTVIEENIVYGNGTGIRLTNSHRNRIVGNTVYDNQLNGVLTERLAAENTVEGNTIYGNSGGVWLAEAKRNRILGNTIVNNWYGGVRISTHSAGNSIRRNRFARNDNGNVVFFVEGIGDVAWWPGFPFKLKAIYLTLLNYLH